MNVSSYRQSIDGEGSSTSDVVALVPLLAATLAQFAGTEQGEFSPFDAHVCVQGGGAARTVYPIASHIPGDSTNSVLEGASA